MKTKLTLLVEEKTILLAKKEAKRKKTSVSKLFELSIKTISASKGTLTPDMEKWFKSLPKVLEKEEIGLALSRKFHAKKTA